MARQITINQFLKATPTDDLLRDAVAPDRSIRAAVALRHVRSYLRAAATQQTRISRAAKRTDGVRAESPVRRRRGFASISEMATEIHFYLICWNAISRNLRLVQKVTLIPGVREAMRPHASTFNRYKDMRDHLEHFDDRLRERSSGARRRKRPLKKPGDMGNFSRETYSFGGDQIAIGPGSLASLRQIVERVMWSIKVGAWEAIARDNPRAAERIARGFFRDRQLKSLLKRSGLDVPFGLARREAD